MYWDEDIDMVTGKKSAPMQGRRASKYPTTEEVPDGFLNEDCTPMRTRKTGVWSDDGSKSIKSKSATNIIEQERFQNDTVSNEEDEIPIIPDIEDLQDDPLNLPDVKPIVTIDKSTYKELDNQLENFQTSGQANFGNLGNIDLSFLTNKLYPENDVREVSEVWTVDSLFKDLSTTS